MNRKTLLICMAVILQMCIFAGCSDDKSEDTPDSSQMSDSDAVTNTENEIALPEMEIEKDTSESEQNVSVKSDKADRSSNDNKAVTVTTKAAKMTVPAVTDKSNAPEEEAVTKTVDSGVSAGAATTETGIDVIELPEIEFD